MKLERVQLYGKRFIEILSLSVDKQETKWKNISSQGN